MVLFNYSTKELTAKVVYYGPGLCGKTTNLQWIHERVPIKNKGKMLSLATETDRTLFFDFLPIELGLIRGMKTRIQLYTVPGQVFYNATRRMVLKGADAVVFVCDSQEPMFDANLESMDNLRQNLEANEISGEEIPMVLQYNKRDLPNALPIEIMNDRINERGLPHFEAVATKGIGVEETLKAVTSLVFRSLALRYGSNEDRSHQSGARQAAAPPVPAPAPAAAAPVPAQRPRSSETDPRPGSFPPTQLPSLQMRSPEPADDLLDSLELTPTPEDDEDEFDIEDLDVDMALDDGHPTTDTPTPPPRPRPLTDIHSTLASSPQEAEEIRARIRRVEPAPEIEEVLSEELGSAPAPGRSEHEITIPPVPPRSAGVPGPKPSLSASEVAEPLRIQVPRDGGLAEVTVPVTVRLGEGQGAAQVGLSLKLLLDLRVKR
jgi:signal recognition particle receptor subunit beta